MQADPVGDGEREKRSDREVHVTGLDPLERAGVEAAPLGGFLLGESKCGPLSTQALAEANLLPIDHPNESFSLPDLGAAVRGAGRAFRHPPSRTDRSF